MSCRMSSAKLQEGLPLQRVHAKAESTRTYLLVAVLHWSNFTPWGILSLIFGFQIYGCWESSVASCIFVSAGKPWRGREEVAGVGIRWLPSHEARGAQHRTCLWFLLAAVTGSRIEALSQVLVRDSTARTQATCMYLERHIGESVTFLLWRFSQVITIIRWQSSPYEWHIHNILIFQFLLFFKDRISYMYILYYTVIWMCCIKTAQWVGLGSVKPLNLITTETQKR